ncbi:hypothetical protein Mal33_28240 [Rosistilla oblonga]|uniref:Uncharacterized protein n=1 Tax=Rosistilla oblonga TaxID=2527990 RepID=A0A518IUQ7_9BACT|nr:hypothetical protein Mal33_28240 [Rosistilla oblonga]
MVAGGRRAAAHLRNATPPTRDDPRGITDRSDQAGGDSGSIDARVSDDVAAIKAAATTWGLYGIR